jgi:hypothetical protein
MGVIKAENGQYQESLLDLKIARENFEIVKLCNEFQEDLLDLLPSLHEAHSYVLEQIGYVAYQSEDLDYQRYSNRFTFLSAKIM